MCYTKYGHFNLQKKKGKLSFDLRDVALQLGLIDDLFLLATPLVFDDPFLFHCNGYW